LKITSRRSIIYTRHRFWQRRRRHIWIWIW